MRPTPTEKDFAAEVAAAADRLKLAAAMVTLSNGGSSSDDLVIRSAAREFVASAYTTLRDLLDATNEPDAGWTQ